MSTVQVNSASLASPRACNTRDTVLVFEHDARLNTRMGSLIKPLVAIALASATITANAGSGLVSAYPASHATLARPPERLRLYFSEPALISDLQIRRSPRATWRLEPTKPGATTAVSLPLPYLMPGTYVVTWQRTGADGHGVQESTSFNVK
jgi:methionine-rich copper-binding protein CopC